MKKSAPEQKTVWERTSVQCLLRNRQSGNYYARLTLFGKQKWISLETDVLTVAKLRLGDKKAEIDKQRGTVAHVEAGKATMGELIETYLARTRANPDFKPATIAARETALKKLTKTWKGIELLEPKAITPPSIFEWISRFKTEGTNFTPNGAKKALKGNSATSVNRAVDTLRRLMDIAIEQGQIHANPVLVRPPTGRLKKKVQQKKLVLPSMAQVEKMLHAMENNGAAGGWGQEAADFCRFLTFTGARLNEAAQSIWEHIDWEREQMLIMGTKTESSERFIPLFPALNQLLQKIIARRKSAARYAPDGKADIDPGDSILRLSECQKSIDSACARTGVPRVTHHDFRHLFATICIESGVDIPTVAGWLGHNDGGVLAMKTYGHLRQEHSKQAALKVNFG